VFSKITLPKISSVIKDRNDIIESDLQEAEKYNMEATSIEFRYQTALKDAKHNIQKKLEVTEDEIKSKLQKDKQEFEMKMNQNLNIAENNINDSINKKDVINMAIGIADSISKKLFGDVINPNEIEKYILESANDKI
jgi:F0F1-type ATP synthase membrane subunit b/b'